MIVRGKLTEEEIEQLDMLCKSPVYAVLRKAMAIHKDECLGLIANESNTTEIYRLQGAIRAIEAVEAAPIVCAQVAATVRAKAEAKEKAESQPRRSAMGRK